MSKLANRRFARFVATVASTPSVCSIAASVSPLAPAAAMPRARPKLAGETNTFSSLRLSSCCRKRLPNSR